MIACALAQRLRPRTHRHRRHRGAAILNLEPGDYTFVVNKDGVICVPNPLSWFSSGGLAAPIHANALTQVVLTCLDTPS